MPPSQATGLNNPSEIVITSHGVNDGGGTMDEKKKILISTRLRFRLQASLKLRPDKPPRQAEDRPQTTELSCWH